MAFKCLNQNAIVCIPDFAGVIRWSSDDPCALVVEHTFTDFLFVTHQHRHALPVHCVLNTASVVRTDRTQLRTGRIEADVKHFVSMVFHRADALSLFHIPQFDSVVSGRSGHLVSTEFKLCVRQFTVVAYKCTHAISRPYVPNLSSVVKWCS